MSQRPKEELTYSMMRRNVRKQVVLPFKFYRLLIEATVTVSSQLTPYKTTLVPIQLSYLKRWFIRDAVLGELRKIKNIKDADLHIEVFAVYGTSKAIGEYERYLGELFFFMSDIHAYDKTEYRYKASKAYYEQPEKSDFIAKRL